MACNLASDGSQTTKLISSSMTKIVDLHHYRTQMVEQRAFGPWRKRFGETYDANTRLSDLSDKTLFFLAQPGEESSMAYYEIIMGVLDLGPATKFNYLASEQQMRVVDIHLFLADQMRFEMMRRLKWLDALYCQNNSFVEMVQDFERIKTSCSEKPPELAWHRCIRARQPTGNLPPETRRSSFASCCEKHWKNLRSKSKLE